MTSRQIRQLSQQTLAATRTVHQTLGYGDTAMLDRFRIPAADRQNKQSTAWLHTLRRTLEKIKTLRNCQTVTKQTTKRVHHSAVVGVRWSNLFQQSSIKCVVKCVTTEIGSTC